LNVLKVHAPSKSALIYLFVDVILTLGAVKGRPNKLAPARRSPQGVRPSTSKVTHALQPSTGQGQAKQPVHGSRHVLVDCVFYLAKKVGWCRQREKIDWQEARKFDCQLVRTIFIFCCPS